MKDPSDQPSAIGVAFEWVGRILAIVAEMVVPGLLGRMLDLRWGTTFFVRVGFVGDLGLAMWHLILITTARPKG